MIHILLSHMIADFAVDVLFSGLEFNLHPGSPKRSYPDGQYSRMLITDSTGATAFFRDVVIVTIPIINVRKVFLPGGGAFMIYSDMILDAK